MVYVDKYTMTAEENVFLAKRKLVDNIYHSARLEGCNVTFPETQTILEGVNVGSVSLDDIQTILNLRDAWRFLLSDLALPLNVDYLCALNGYVSRNESLEWGKLRTGNIGIGGTNYRPAIPVRETVTAELERLLDIGCVTERAIEIFLWGCRAQLFWDGNKRTSALAANSILIRNGAGILTVRDEHLLEFNKLLLDYYNTGEKDAIKRFLYETSITGLEL
jgi:Fic family protein